MKPRTVHPAPPDAIRGGACFWTAGEFEVRELNGVVTVHLTGFDELEETFTVTRDDNFRLVGALVSALAWAEDRDQEAGDVERQRRAGR